MHDLARRPRERRFDPYVRPRRGPSRRRVGPRRVLRRPEPLGMGWQRQVVSKRRKRMSSDGRGCVVVGAGLAAATVARTLREGGFDHPVTLIGDERERPYERPALSKDYLQGKSDAADLYVHSSDWYADHQVRTHFGETVLGIDRGRCEVRLQSAGRWRMTISSLPPVRALDASACGASIWQASTRSGESKTPTSSALHWLKRSGG